MIKKVLIAYLLIFSIKSWGQSFYRYDLNQTNDCIAKEMDLYVNSLNTGKDLLRNSSIDSCARLRTEYFLDLLEINAKSKGYLRELLDSVPPGKKAHQECFGNPSFFLPSEGKYPISFFDVINQGVRTTGEVMGWFRSVIEFDSKQNPNEIVRLTLEEIKNLHGISPAKKMITNYQKSKSHDQVIKNRGDGKFGSSTEALVLERKIGNKWIYEVVIFNVVNFTTQI